MGRIELLLLPEGYSTIQSNLFWFRGVSRTNPFWKRKTQGYPCNYLCSVHYFGYYGARLKLMDTSTVDWPEQGSNFQWRIASSAAVDRMRFPLIVFTSLTLPSASTLASTVTEPSIFMRLAISG